MRISIITVSYNSEETIGETIESVASQTYPYIEHLIIDGKSRDDTVKIVKKSPSVSKIISEPDKGIYDAMNKGILNSTGEVIGILNSDDIYADEHVLSEIAQVFEERPKVDAVYGNLVFFSNSENRKGIRFWAPKPYYSTFFEDGEVPPHPTLFVRKKVYDQNGLYVTNLRNAADYEFMLRIFKLKKVEPFYIDRTIVNMRMGGESTQKKNWFLNNSEVKKSWEMNNLPIPSSFWTKRFLKKITQIFSKNKNSKSV